LLGNYVFADVSYTLPTGDQKYPRRHLESYAEVVSLYTVRGRVDPPAFVATEPDGFRYAPPADAAGLADTLYSSLTRQCCTCPPDTSPRWRWCCPPHTRTLQCNYDRGRLLESTDPQDNTSIR
jgi:hypothetical protein